MHAHIPKERQRCRKYGASEGERAKSTLASLGDRRGEEMEDEEEIPKEEKPGRKARMRDGERIEAVG